MQYIYVLILFSMRSEVALLGSQKTTRKKSHNTFGLNSPLTFYKSFNARDVVHAQEEVLYLN